MKIKKYYCLFIAIIMIFALAGCGKTNPLSSADQNRMNTAKVEIEQSAKLTRTQETGKTKSVQSSVSEPVVDVKQAAEEMISEPDESPVKLAKAEEQEQTSALEPITQKDPIEDFSQIKDEIQSVVEALLQAYEWGDEMGFMDYVHEDFRSLDRGYGYHEMARAVGDDFAQLKSIQFYAFADPPLLDRYPEMIRVKLRWSRRARNAVTGEEHIIRNQTSILWFTYDPQREQYLLSCIEGDPIFGITDDLGQLP